mmetsp:Transcript_7816/g.12503  ORF Transcript_7816/g.12503 Transcript_7816/m.12503 type:complete len:324 (-) Transcript_7816:137-1108(-)
MRPKTTESSAGMKHAAHENLSAFDEMIAGGVAGAVARCVVAPLDVVKIRMQLQVIPRADGVFGQRKYKGVLHCLSTIVREEGIRALWKGNLTAEYLATAYTAVQFAIYKQLQVVLRPDDKKKEGHVTVFGRKVVCGSLAGGIATAVSYPFDIIRTRLSAQGEPKVYRGMRSALKATLSERNGSWRGLFQGLNPAIIQIVPSAALSLAFYDSIKAIMVRDGQEASDIDNLTAGAISGLLSKAIVYPLDLVKRRLQVQRSPLSQQQHVFGGVWVAIVAIVRHEGPLALWRGLPATLIKAVPNVAITFAVYEHVAKLLLERKNKRS